MSNKLKEEQYLKYICVLNLYWLVIRMSFVSAVRESYRLLKRTRYNFSIMCVYSEQNKNVLVGRRIKTGLPRVGRLLIGLHRKTGRLKLSLYSVVSNKHVIHHVVVTRSFILIVTAIFSRKWSGRSSRKRRRTKESGRRVSQEKSSVPSRRHQRRGRRKIRASYETCQLARSGRMTIMEAYTELMRL